MIETFEIVSKAIADPSRIRILKVLEKGELCVCQITTVTGLSAPAISKALGVLKAAGLVQLRREGRWAYYRLADRALNPYALSFLTIVQNSLLEDPSILEDQRILELVKAVPIQIVCDQGRSGLGALDLDRDVNSQ